VVEGFFRFLVDIGSYRPKMFEADSAIVSQEEARALCPVPYLYLYL
jgi:hypothetical protein